MWNAFDAQDVTLEDFLAISVNKPDVLSDSFWNDLHSFIEWFPIIDEEFPFTRAPRVIRAANQIAIYPIAIVYRLASERNFSQLFFLLLSFHTSTHSFSRMLTRCPLT